MRSSGIIADYYRLSRKRSISADEMYSMTCVEWDVDHSDVNRSIFDDDMREKRFLRFRSL